MSMPINIATTPPRMTMMGNGRDVANASRIVTQQPIPYDATWPSETRPTLP